MGKNKWKILFSEAVFFLLFMSGVAVADQVLYSKQLDAYFHSDGSLLDCSITGGAPPKCYEQPFDVRFLRSDKGDNPFRNRCFRSALIRVGVYGERVKPEQAEEVAKTIVQKGMPALDECNCMNDFYEDKIGMEDIGKAFPKRMKDWILKNRPDLMQEFYDRVDQCYKR